MRELKSGKRVATGTLKKRVAAPRKRKKERNKISVFLFPSKQLVKLYKVVGYRGRQPENRVLGVNSHPTLSDPLDTTTATRFESAPPNVPLFLYH